MKDEGVLFRVVGFYLGPVILLILISGGALALWLARQEPSPEAMIVAALTIILASLAGWWIYHKTQNTDKLVELLKEGHRQSRATSN